MEQDELLYEYKMGGEVFRFEARSHAEALLMRGPAIAYFTERARGLFDEDAIVGPDRVEMPESFVYVGASKQASAAERRADL
jgi:hypothetical protein